MDVRLHLTRVNELAYETPTHFLPCSHMVLSRHAHPNGAPCASAAVGFLAARGSLFFDLADSASEGLGQEDS